MRKDSWKNFVVLRKVPGRRSVMKKKVYLVLLLMNVMLFLAYFFILGEWDEDNLEYTPNFTVHLSEDALDQKFYLCLLEPPDASDTVSINSFKLNVLNSYRNISFLSRKARSFNVLVDFTFLMSSLNVETFLVDPLILFCMISPLLKNQLLKRKFDPKKFGGSERVWTFGIFEEDVPRLENVEAQREILSSGFNINFVREPTFEWMNNSRTVHRNESSYCSHVIITKNVSVVHLVVFFRRGTFLWHAALKRDAIPSPDLIKDLRFIESNSAFENFSSISLGSKAKSWTNISIPSNPQYFLFEMASSKFLECNSTLVSSFFEHQSSGGSAPFQKRAMMALQELKKTFIPQLMSFWIWSGTMLGWYRQCGIIPYTSDVDFAAWAHELEDLSQLTRSFGKSDHLEVRERMGFVTEGLEFNLRCHKLRVDVFFMYNVENGTWYAGHRPSQKYYFRYYHPNVTLCSAELLGHKVNVPCNTEEVLVAEYGPNWMKPVEHWDYERSIFNRGPDIYWDKDLVDKAYA